MCASLLDRPGFESCSLPGRRRHDVCKAELQTHVLAAAIDLGVRKDEPVNRPRALWWRQDDVSTRGELHAIGIEVAKVEVAFGRLLALPGFADIHREPAGIG